MIWMLIMMKWWNDLVYMTWILKDIYLVWDVIHWDILKEIFCIAVYVTVWCHEISYHNSNAMFWDIVSCNYVNVILDIMKCKFVIHVILNVLRCNDLQQ